MEADDQEYQNLMQLFQVRLQLILERLLVSLAPDIMIAKMKSIFVRILIKGFQIFKLSVAE